MIHEINLVVTPKQASDNKFLKPILASKLKIEINEITFITILKKSIDARSKNVKINLRLKVGINQDFVPEPREIISYQNVENKPEVIIVGAGPGGYFAALRLLELGLKPIVFERGKDVDERKKDLYNIHSKGVLNSSSNYSFGEGGAGTFSDGKLYTRSKKRGSIKKILEIFHNHGADEKILIDSHPHIGTNKLPKIIANIRETIIKHGGQVYFNHCVTDFIIDKDTIKGVFVNDKKYFAKAVILATGHSARDIYSKLYDKKIYLEFKPFAMGVRLEHPQELIDQIQYHSPQGRGKYLPAAEYNFVTQINNRGVYSFCMCPGGVVVPASTGENQQVVNGMSSSGRNSKFSNSAMVVEIREEDLKKYGNFGPLAGMKFQEYYEELSYKAGTDKLEAPAQRMVDFVSNTRSKNLPKSSYKPGIVSSELHKWIPSEIRHRLQEGFKVFGKKSRGFLTNEALLLGVESRTSAPVRITRNKEDLQHIEIKKLFPCGEGAGYAGGIASAAIDGERCAQKVAQVLNL